MRSIDAWWWSVVMLDFEYIFHFFMLLIRATQGEPLQMSREAIKTEEKSYQTFQTGSWSLKLRQYWKNIQSCMLK